MEMTVDAQVAPVFEIAVNNFAQASRLQTQRVRAEIDFGIALGIQWKVKAIRNNASGSAWSASPAKAGAMEKSVG